MARAEGCPHSGQAHGWISAALISAALVGSANGGPNIRPENCAKQVVGSIDDIVNAAYDIAQAALDCTLPGLDQLSCAGDLTDMLSYWFNLGNKVSTLTLVCGNLDNACAANVLQAFGDISDTSNELVAAAQDCTTDSWLCAYDIVSAVDNMDNFVGDIIYSLQTCNNGAIPPVDVGGFNADFQEFSTSYRGVPGDGGFFVERRLRGAPKDSDDVADGEPKTAVSAEALVANPAMTDMQWDTVYSQFQAELPQLSTLIKKRQAASGVAEVGTAEERKVAWESLVDRVRSRKLGAAAATAAAAVARVPQLQLQSNAEEIYE